MVYRRDESFRFQFTKPLHGTFKIIKIDDRTGGSNTGSIDILDLSPKGLKFKSNLELPIDKKRLLLEVTILINDRLIRIMGSPKWKKTMAQGFIYGFEGVEDFETKKEIIEELKEFSKKALLEK